MGMGMGMGMFNPLYLVIMIVPMLLSMYAQNKVKSTFNKYSQVGSERGITGANAARKILDGYGLAHVGVERSQGFLSDHYDPRSKTLRLSDGVYDSSSLAAVGVAAHEAGHALQDKESYGPLRWRSSLVPAAQFGSNWGPRIIGISFMIMFAAQSASSLVMPLAWLGVIIMAAATLFTLVTLPVEFDASKRAKQLLVAQGVTSQHEIEGVDKVLDAAALTYLAAAVASILQLAYYVFMLLGRRD